MMKKIFTIALLVVLPLCVFGQEEIPITKLIEMKLAEWEAVMDYFDSYQEDYLDGVLDDCNTALDNLGREAANIVLMIGDFEQANEEAKKGASGVLSAVEGYKPKSREEFGLTEDFVSLVKTFNGLAETLMDLKEQAYSAKTNLIASIDLVKNATDGVDTDYATRDWIYETFGASWEQYAEMWAMYQSESAVDIGEHICGDDCYCRTNHEFDYSEYENTYNRCSEMVGRYIEDAVINAPNIPE